jgi:hypothetical protein
MALAFILRISPILPEKLNANRPQFASMRRPRQTVPHWICQDKGKDYPDGVGDLVQAVDELKAGNDEVAAMMLRTAYNALSDIEQPRRAGVDEQILDRIFSRFCIGK